MTVVQEPKEPPVCEIRSCGGILERRVINSLPRLQCMSVSNHAAWLVELKGQKSWEFSSRGKGGLKGKLLPVQEQATNVKARCEPAQSLDLDKPLASLLEPKDQKKAGPSKHIFLSQCLSPSFFSGVTFFTLKRSPKTWKKGTPQNLPNCSAGISIAQLFVTGCARRITSRSWQQGEEGQGLDDLTTNLFTCAYAWWVRSQKVTSP